MSHMVYEDYRKSALKHLKTCEYMLENLHHVPDSDLLDGLTRDEWKNHILRNIYYLCGYAIEGIVNYCIYKQLRFSSTSDVKTLQNDNLRSLSSSFRRNTGICFNRFQQGSSGIWYYTIHNHNYIKNIEILKTTISNFNTIAIVSRPKDPLLKTSLLYYDWDVEMRYQTDSPILALTYDEEDILNFFIFVKEEIYSKLPTLC